MTTKIAILLVCALYTGVTFATVLEDWPFDDGTELSNTSNTEGPTSWTADMDAEMSVSGGTLSQDAGADPDNFAYADVADAASGTRSVVAEGISIVNWSATTDKVTLYFNASSNTNNAAAGLELQYIDGNIKLSGKAPNGTDLGVVKSFTGASISNLTIGVEYNMSGDQYRVVWKESGRPWRSSIFGSTYVNHDVERINFLVHGWNSAGESIYFDRIYVTDAALPEPESGLENTDDALNDWRFNDGAELSDTSDQAGSASWTTNLDVWSSVDLGTLSQDSLVDPASAGVANADVDDVSSGVYSVVMEGLSIDNWNTIYDMVELILNPSSDSDFVAASVQLVYDGSGVIELNGFSGGSGVHLGTVTTFAGGSIFDLSVGVEFEISSDRYRVAWKETGGEWQFSAYSAAHPTHDVKRVTIKIRGYNSSGETVDIDRIYTLGRGIIRPPSGTLVFIR